MLVITTPIIFILKKKNSNNYRHAAAGSCLEKVSKLTLHHHSKWRGLGGNTTQSDNLPTAGDSFGDILFPCRK